jgi:serine/threonine-protein kinase RsbT
MAIHMPSSEPIKIKIDTEDDIVTVRQRVRSLAQESGFDPFAIAAMTTSASELSRNVWRHATSGMAEIQVLREGERIGLQLEVSDQGPGIADLQRALAGGYSTVKSLGLGLSGTKRLVDEFHIDTAPGRGTKVTIRKWKRGF